MTEQTQPNGDEGVPDFSVPVGAADVMTLPLDQTNGYGDAELAAYERLEDQSYDGEEDGAGAITETNDAALAALEERTERLAELLRQQQSSKIHRKVSAGVAGGALVGGLPAVLQSLDVTALPASVQPFVVLAAAIVGLFGASYMTPEREAPAI